MKVSVITLKLYLRFILRAAVIGLPLNSMNLLRIRHLITKYKIDSHFFKKRFPWLVGMLEEHSKSFLKITRLTARDLRAFFMFSQHPAGVY